VHSNTGLNGHQDRQTYLQLLAQATEFDLQRAGNKTFLELWTSKKQLEYALNAQKLVLKSLIVHILTVYRDLVQQLLSSRTQVVSESSVSSITGTRTVPVNDTPDNLDLPPPPEQLEQEDFPNVQFWKSEEWSKYIDREKENGRKVSNMGWLTDESGEEIDDSTLKKMTEAAYALFGKFFYLRLDPSTWRLRHPEVTTYFCNTMRKQFHPLNLADDDWKAHAFARSRYPNWNQYHRETGHLKRKLFSYNHLTALFDILLGKYPSINSSSNTGAGNHRQSKKQRQSLAAQVIEILGDEQDPPSTSSVVAIRKPQPRLRDKRAATPVASSNYFVDIFVH